MKTTFLLWLEARGESARAFGLRMKMPQHSVYTLAGIQHTQPVQNLGVDLVRAVERETGIKWTALIEEAEAARANPVPPRKYTRRQQDAAE